MTDEIETAIRCVSLHEQVAVLKAKVREMNDFDMNVRLVQIRELKDELARTKDERDAYKARCERYVERLKGDGR